LIIYRITATIFLLALLACAGPNSAIQSKLDPKTSATITYSQTPLVFYRDDSGKAAFARNYLHLGPLEVNRMGSIHYYLWLGIWNTMQDAGSGESHDGFESIVIFVDGEPLPLELSGWSQADIGASEAVYVRPVATATDAYYEITIDQLRLIAASKDLRVQPAGAGTRGYELWDEQKSARKALNEFLKNSLY
jgi:hypothetical protein